jgi:type I restriction enzyme S subunit
MAKLGDVLCRIETGKSFLTAEVLARPDQLAVLKVSAVSWDTFRPEQAKVVVGYEPEERHRIRAGDFLISRANTRELVGAVVRVEQDHPLRLLSDKTLRLVINEARASPDYLLFALRSSAARTHIEAHATGTSDSMRNISRDVIAATPIWLPDLDVQRRIAARLKAQLAAVEQARKAAQAQLADLEALPARLLAMAFDGSGDTIGGDGKSTDSVRGEPVEP